jgi:NAD(P)-dependent dehydrogenase (short-subunit alcohol dehydrogenase family)
VPFFGAISASKAALASLSDAMRMEFAPFGVDVVLIEPGAIATDILKTSGERQEEAVSKLNPRKSLLYRPAIEAMRKAMAAAAVDKPEVVADAVVASLLAKRPKPRRLVGKGASQLAVLRKLPIRLRDRILTGSLGIAKALKIAAATEAAS